MTVKPPTCLVRTRTIPGWYLTTRRLKTSKQRPKTMTSGSTQTVQTWGRTSNKTSRKEDRSKDISKMFSAPLKTLKNCWDNLAEIWLTKSTPSQSATKKKSKNKDWPTVWTSISKRRLLIPTRTLRDLTHRQPGRTSYRRHMSKECNPLLSPCMNLQMSLSRV